MDTKLSHRVALELIKADSVEEINAVLKDIEAVEWFDDPQHWSPYGNRAKNWEQGMRLTMVSSIAIAVSIRGPKPDRHNSPKISPPVWMANRHSRPSGDRLSSLI